METVLPRHTLEIGLRAIREIGFDVEPLRSHVLDIPKNQGAAGVTETEWYFWEYVFKNYNKKDIVFAMANALDFGAFGFLDYIASCSPNVGAAFQYFCKFSNYIYGDWNAGFAFLENENVFKFDLRTTRTSEANRHSSEFSLATLYNRSKRISSNGNTLISVHFRHTPSFDVSAYKNFFEIDQINFEAPFNGFKLVPDIMSHNCRNSDNFVLGSMVNLGFKLVKNSEESVSQNHELEKVREIVKRLTGKVKVDLQVVAAEIGTSARSLQRLLKKSKSSFKTIKVEESMNYARQRLELGESIKTIALSLQYGDPSAFSRAYRSWFGQPPTEVKKRKIDSNISQ